MRRDTERSDTSRDDTPDEAHAGQTRAEQTRRAELHRALSDPLRIAIIDELAYSDLSPSELEARLGVTSNLLAHHVDALEAVGLVTRTPSQGDRRRKYLSLSEAGWPFTRTLPAIDAERIVFVCTGNSARSPLAAALWRHSDLGVRVTSAGTQPAERVHPLAVEAGRRVGIDVDHAPQRIYGLARPGDLVITVCDQAHEDPETVDAIPEGAAGTLHWSIPDPVADSRPEAFAHTIDLLRERTRHLARQIALQHP